MKTVTILITMLCSAAPLSAQGWIEHGVPGGDGGGEPNGIHRTRTEVSVTVKGSIAVVEVEEWFENRGGRLEEGDYLYPLPRGATFSNLSLFQGEHELRGEIMDARIARSIYEEIVRRKKDPALVELVGKGLIRARVFPIGAGETRKIKLRYTELLERQGGALEFRYLGARKRTAAGPGGRPERPGGSLMPDGAPLSLHLIVENGDTFADPFSPTHEVDINRTGNRLVVTASRNLSGELSIFLPFARETVGLSFAAHRRSAEPGYFMLTLSPGNRAARETQARDVTAVLDVSGSMSGIKIEQARSALGRLLSSLHPRDRFRLVAFNGMVRSQSDEFLPATPRNLDSAVEWILRLNADGGTNIALALSDAFRVQPAEGHLPIVLFITDGLPSVGEKDPDRIARIATRERGGARVFTFGVGYDVNTYLLDRLSGEGRGATQYVRPGESIERAVGSLAQKISRPVLTGIAIAGEPARFTDVYPVSLPDLFAGEELVIIGRYRDARDGKLTVSGLRNGVRETYSVDVSLPRHQELNEFIPKLWASRKIAVLSRQIRLNGESAELVDEIRKTALRYGILSEYTSYLVQEPEVVTSRDAPATPAGLGYRLSGDTRSSSGKAAVSRARREQIQAKVGSLEQLARLEDEAKQESASSSLVRVVAGRTFRLVDRSWQDARHTGSQDVMTVEPYSDAYFAVLEKLPELQPYFTSFENVLIAGEKISIRVASGGKTKLYGAGIVKLVQRFRGQ